MTGATHHFGGRDVMASYNTMCVFLRETLGPAYLANLGFDTQIGKLVFVANIASASQTAQSFLDAENARYVSKRSISTCRGAPAARGEY